MVLNIFEAAAGIRLQNASDIPPDFAQKRQNALRSHLKSESDVRSLCKKRKQHTLNSNTQGFRKDST